MSSKGDFDGLRTCAFDVEQHSIQVASTQVDKGKGIEQQSAIQYTH